MKFHSPYQFINIRPATAKISYKVKNKKKLIQDDYTRHDYWAEDGLTGEISCTLTTQSPLVIGAKQNKGTNKKPGVVNPYKHPDGTIALPANSLRGMISSLAENISQSSLRVLAKRKDSIYSVRKTVKRNGDKALKNIGMIYKKNNDTYLFPLEKVDIPSYPFFKGGDDHITREKKYNNFLKANQTARFIKNHNSFHLEDNNQIVYANINNNIVTFLSEEKSAKSPIAGILYIRGKYFDAKQKELFLPLDNGEEIEINESKLIQIPQCVIERIETSLFRYYEKENPNRQLPKGYERNWNKSNAELIKAGDLIYYDEHDGIVTELSYSQIWRKPVEGNLHKAIQDNYGKNTLPWNKNREKLTPAEALFGVVETDFKEEDGARNLASRIRFSDAKPNNKLKQDDLDNEVILKILDSPKPPSPSMYFQDKNGDNQKAISKQQLDLNEHTPNGRKHYLPHSPTHKLHSDREDWQTGFEEDESKNNYPKDSNNKKNWSQYLKVTPIPKNQVFIFTIHFENLNKFELGLLVTTIEPSDGENTFIHKLGLGKPLGLGEINLKIENIETTNKSENYTAEALKEPPTFIEVDKQALKQLAINKGYVNQDTLNELQILYNPNNIKHPVCYPFSSPDNQKMGEEGEGFKWFGLNESLSGKNNVKQCLTPIQTTIPALSDFNDYLIIRHERLKKNQDNILLKNEIEFRIKEAEVHQNKLIFKEDSQQSITNLLSNNPHKFDIGRNKTILVTFSKP